MLAEIGHRVEVEIERLAGEQVFSGELRVPHGEQPRHLLRGDARGVFRQEALLGHSVEPAEQCQPLVGDQRHHVALAFNRPELEGQRGAERMRGRDHARAGQLGALRQSIAVEAHQIGDEQEQPSHRCGELTRVEDKVADIGDGLGVGTDADGALLNSREFTTTVGGLFLFVPDLVRLDGDALAQGAKLPGSRMIPPAHALRASLALKLWAIERKSHVMALVADEGLALFCGLNAMPKKSFLSEYSSRITPQKVSRLLAVWDAQLTGENLFVGQSINLDFHSMPYFGEQPLVQSHYSASRRRRQPSILTFLAQDADSQVFCYSNAYIRKVEEADEIFRFIDFWKRQYGKAPQHLVFDSKLTTYQGLDRLDAAGITFLTLRRRSPSLLAEVDHLPPSAWRTITLDVPHRKYRNPRVYEQKACPRQRTYRQFFITDLGHDEPTILLTNDARSTAKKLIARYAKRMLIENALADAVRFFHIDALSSSVGFKVDFDMALLVLASGLYRLMARRMRGYDDAQARQIFRDLIDMPADVAITENEVTVRFHRRAHLPIVLASGLIDKPVKIPWWSGRSLRLIQ